MFGYVLGGEEESVFLVDGGSISPCLFDNLRCREKKARLTQYEPPRPKKATPIRHKNPNDPHLPLTLQPPRKLPHALPHLHALPRHNLPLRHLHPHPH